MSKIIPWEEFEEEYAKQFSENKWESAKPFSMALGLLIIKEILRRSDRETVEQIKENPYLELAEKSWKPYKKRDEGI